MENLEELVNAAVDYGNSENGLRDFIDHAALTADTDRLLDSQAGVTMMTVHSAKGLEFPVVFIVGLEDGIFRIHAASSDQSELEKSGGWHMLPSRGPNGFVCHALDAAACLW